MVTRQQQLEADEDYKKLTNIQKKFVSNVINGFNYTEAYMQAGSKTNRRAAAVKGSELAISCRELIERHIFIPNTSIEKMADKTLGNLAAIAFADPAEIIDNKTGKPKALKDMPLNLRLAITEIEIEGDVVKYKFGGKTKSLEMLAKIGKLFNDQQNVQVAIITEEDRDNKIREILISAANRNIESGD